MIKVTPLAIPEPTRYDPDKNTSYLLVEEDKEYRPEPVDGREVIRDKLFLSLDDSFPAKKALRSHTSNRFRGELPWANDNSVWFTGPAGKAKAIREGGVPDDSKGRPEPGEDCMANAVVYLAAHS